MQALVEYLLAYRHKNAGKLVRFGGLWVETILPAGFALVYELAPQAGTYAHIQFEFSCSEKIVPDTIWLRVEHSGIEINAGFINSVLTHFLSDSWIVYTGADPIRIFMTNTSNQNQYYESIAGFLIIDSLENYKIVEELCNNYFEGGVYNARAGS